MHRPMKTANQRLRVEPLEARLMMAGDVTAEVVGGHLRVLGDADDNRIVITQIEPGKYQVAASDDSTTINGQAQGTPFVASGVTKSFEIGMGDGNDRVELRNLVVPRNLGIRTGDGDDGVALTNVRVAGNVAIGTGAGADTVVLRAAEQPQPVLAAVRTRARAVAEPPPQGVGIGGNLAIETGDGDDVVRIAHARIRQHAHISTGDGVDRVLMGALAEESSATADVAETPSEPFAVHIGRHLSIATGSGNDIVRLNSVRARAAFLNLGEGDDQLFAANSSADYVFALLGAGNDLFDASAGGNTVSEHFLLFGGPGEDTLKNAASNSVANAHVHGVEISV